MKRYFALLLKGLPAIILIVIAVLGVKNFNKSKWYLLLLVPLIVLLGLVFIYALATGQMKNPFNRKDNNMDYQVNVAAATKAKSI